MILYYKTKILISGLFPMVNFKIDGFIEKTELYDENMIDINNPDYIFCSSGHLLNSMYACKEKEGNYYEYFENEEMIKYEVDDEMSRTDVEKKILDEFIKKELNITDITRLNIDNNINYISVVSNNEIEIIKKNGSDK